jgi:hypothetical protein
LTWLLDSQPSVENLVRAEKLRDILSNRVATVDAVIKIWRVRLNHSTAVQEPASAVQEESSPPSQAGRKSGHTVASLIQTYQTNPASSYRNKAYKTRYTTDRLCRAIIEDMGELKIAEVTADFVRDLHGKWTARSAGSGKGNGDGAAMAHALLTQLRTVVNYGAKTLEDSDCLRLSFALRNLGIKIAKPSQNKTVNLAQAKAVIRVAHERGLHSVALAHGGAEAPPITRWTWCKKTQLGF